MLFALRAMQKKQSRRNKFIQPRLQLWLVSSFVGLAALGLLLQFLILGFRLTSRAADLELGGEVADALPALLLETLAFSLAVLVPVIFGIGILLTFRIAGPVHRFEQYLKSVVRGEQLGPCKIREKDRLQSLCDLINEATEPVRRGRLRSDEDDSQRAAE